MSTILSIRRAQPPLANWYLDAAGGGRQYMISPSHVSGSGAGKIYSNVDLEAVKLALSTTRNKYGAICTIRNGEIAKLHVHILSSTSLSLLSSWHDEYKLKH